ncbi:MAG: hypothetical protein KGZ81_06090, partial [Flavobacteriales bacterium]|nr:hypothetical protein [Flavobacteriales bacterium]
FGFVDGNQQGNDYQYDMFGNMTQDLNKEIEEIKYNHLNLPTTIIFANGGVIAYLYDAMGVKVRKYVHQQGANNSWTDYLNGFQYSNEILQFFPHAEGYVQYYQEGEENGNTNQGNDGAPLQEGFSYVYQYKDHLGNNRLNYTLNREGTLSILSEDHYYPFGMKHPYNNDRREWAFIRIENIPTPFVRQVPNSGYQYKYNGKEWQDELGLNVTAMDFRQYDPAIGRFYGIDRLAELAPMHNPYRFGFNNPIYWSDPSGLSETNTNFADYYDKNGVVYFDPNVGPNNVPDGATYIGPTYINPETGTFWDENGQPHVNSTELEGVVAIAKRNNNSNNTNTNTIHYLNFLNDRIGDGADILGYTKNQGGSFRLTNGKYNGNNFSPKYYGSNWTGGSTAGIKTYNLSKVLKKGSIVTTVVLGTIEVGQGVSQDYQNYQNTGYTNGKNTAVATAKVGAGIAVGWAAGAATGAAIGTAIPIPVVGTVVGAIVGGVAGYYASEAAGSLVEKAYE